MGTKILRTGLGIASSKAALTKFNRPDDWLDFPSLVDGDEEVYMLVHVTEKGDTQSTIRIYGGDYDVDWGDGTTTSHTGGDVASHTYTYSGLSSTTQLEDGKRQAIVKVTPQGSSFTSTIDFIEASYYSIVDIKMASQGATSIAIAGVNTLQQFEWVGSNTNITSFYNTFSNCWNLKKVVSIPTSNVTNFRNMFYNNYSLLEVPEGLIQSNSTTITQSMFQNCRSLEKLPDMDLSKPNLTNAVSMFSGCFKLRVNPVTSADYVTGTQTMFASCFNLKEVTIDFPAVINTQSMFASCTSLEKVTSDFPSLTSPYRMFTGCYSLSELKPFDTSNVTGQASSFRETFNGCRSLSDFSWVDFSSYETTTGGYALFKDTAIEKIPKIWNTSQPISLGGLFNGNITLRYANIPSNVQANNIGYAFNSCYNLDGVSLFDTSQCTNIGYAFNGCYNISYLPAFNFSGVTTTGTNSFRNCTSLRWSDVYGLVVTHTYQNCKLSREAIVNVFNNLGTASGSQTITLTQNPGSGDLTPTDIAIATGKGWTVLCIIRKKKMGAGM
jgi:hypothetical protein